MTITVPTAYRPGYEKARRTDPELAARYIEHTTKGDPLADAAIAAMHGMPQERIHHLITAGMDEDEAVFRNAPAALKELIAFSSATPGWFDSRAVYPGCRAFHRDSDLYVQALVGSSIVRGFSTLISKSFFMTGRLTDHGVRRLRQNIRQLIEIMIPGGMDRHGEGWKLSVRIRLIHAQVRYFLRRSEEWDEAEFGVPMHIGHIALASANFSAKVIEAAKRLGAEPTAEESEAFVQIWRYSAHLLGVPETILFRNEQEALDLFEVGFTCEPRPEIESIVMGNALVNSAPVVIGIRQPKKREHLAHYVYPRLPRPDRRRTRERAPLPAPVHLGSPLLPADQAPPEQTAARAIPALGSACESGPLHRARGQLAVARTPDLLPPAPQTALRRNPDLVTDPDAAVRIADKI